MKVLNKLLMASAMVVTLGATASCGNKQQTDITGLPYTILHLSCHNAPVESLTVEFDCEGEPTTYWGDGTIDNEKIHTYTSDDNGDFYYSILISGDIKSLQFANKDGCLSNGNIWIDEVTFSNTITHLPEYSFSKIATLEFLYIPSNITTIGDNVFSDSLVDSCRCIFEPISRPEGWSTKWCTASLIASSIWGVSFYVDEKNEYMPSYLLVNAQSGADNEAYYTGPLLNLIYPTSEAITQLDIPESVTVNNKKYSMVGIESAQSVWLSLKTVNIPKTVKYIFPGAFEDCKALETVNFAPDSDLRIIHEIAFSGCDSLKSIVLPNKLEEICYGAFGASTPLESIVIPRSVRKLAEDIIGSYNDHPTVKVDITAYQDPQEIAVCEDLTFCYCEKVTFIFDSSKLNHNDFYSKKWPKHDGTKYIWQPAPTTSLS